MNESASKLTRPRDTGGRRGVLLALGGLSLAWLGALVYPIYRFLSPPSSANPFGATGKAKVDKITPADVARPGQGKNGGYAGRGLIVLRGEDGTLRAFDAKCSHAGCNVSFEGSRIHCPCHGGIYDLTGKNVSGPPPRPLTALRVVEENGELYVSRADAEAGS
ncbi:MAG TPA: Rieske (2Fe-2S) protein [Polyangiaceae bacterium]|nr:Rieske (2Fe-2S) protein [Polyangiaceae bacterium]